MNAPRFLSDPDAARAQLAAALLAVGAGDRAALEHVYRMTSAKLFGICLRICGERGQAEDVLQTVYVKVWERAGQFDADRASPVTWLATIARNSAIDWRRSAAGRTAGAMLPEAAALAVADSSPLADAQMEHMQTADRLHHCLGELDARTRDAIRLAFFDGATYADLAAQGDVPLGTMKSWIRRGLLRLKDCLGDG